MNYECHSRESGSPKSPPCKGGLRGIFQSDTRRKSTFGGEMKTIFRLTFASMALAIIAIAAFPARGLADTTPQEMHISCTAPNPDHQTGLHRPKGDGNIWTFQIVLDGDARFVKGPYWSYPGKDGSDPDWGLWTGGADGDSSLGWSSPGKTGDFQIRVNGQIVCGDGPGGQPIDFSAGWDGSVDFNAEIKVKRSGTDDNAYSDSATVAVGGLGSSEHKADVIVIATDGDGNPMPSITVDAPTIQNGDGTVPAKNASISAVNATTDGDGKAYFTFTSSDILRSVTLEEDGGESSASASIEQDWTNLPDGNDEGESWEYDPYYDYEVASNVIFKMALDEAGTIPITGHDIHFVTTQVSGWKWDPNAGDDWDDDGNPNGDYVYQESQDYDLTAAAYGDLVTYSSVNEGPSGNYVTQQTIHENDYFEITDIVFKISDRDAFSN